MNFSKEWEERYQANTHMSIWPWTDLVAYVHRYAAPKSGFNKVLELGCGAGANIPFFLKLEVDYAAVEGSETIVTMLHQNFPALKEAILVGDFTKEIPFEGPFDLIVDRGSLVSNTTIAMRSGLKLAYEKLRSGGKMVGIDWFSLEHSDADKGDAADSHTRTNFPESSHLAGLGNIHFFDKAHLEELLTGAGFEIERLEHKIVETITPDSGQKLAWWHFVAVKA